MPVTEKQLTEEEVKQRYITPALHWDSFMMRMEVRLTDGEIQIGGNEVVRDRNTIKKPDYVLYGNRNCNHPLAVVEAKKMTFSISHGLQQAMEYAQMLDAPFAYSSNGEGFEEYDFLTGQERTLTLNQFPTLEELLERRKAEANGGKGLTEAEETVQANPNYSDANTFQPRYYQQVAINRTLDAIAKGQKRILLAMATGTGKTYTAFQIVYQLLKLRMKSRILYIADRNILVDQTMSQDFHPLEKEFTKIDMSKFDLNKMRSYRLCFSLYQQLVSDEGEEKFRKFPQDFFDLIIVDECHRGSAKANSQWRKVLDYFSGATQIGMTATPKETEDVSNSTYFGEPLYIYSLNQGIKDGFLAPYKFYRIRTNIGEGWRPVFGTTDINGNLIEDREYNNTDYDYNIIIPARTKEVAKEITKYLKATDRMAKTIVFCADEDAAERMRKELVNLNSDMMQGHPDYIVRITGSDEYGKGKLKEFISVSEPYPVIATTSELLSTGVDCKMVKLIVIDKNISSMISFKQIVGRGTRIRENEGKLCFAIMDFRGVSHFFTDPGWDGPIEVVDGFDPTRPAPSNPSAPDNQNKKKKPIVDAHDCPVNIIDRQVFIYNPDGKLLRAESITDYTKENILGQYASLDEFIQSWSESKKKAVIRDHLSERGIDLEQIKQSENMNDVDDFDFICHLAFDQKPLTRKQRAEKVRNSGYFDHYQSTAREVLEYLLSTYENQNIYNIETTDVLKIDPICRLGKPSKIASYFVGRENYEKAVSGMEAILYGQAGSRVSIGA